MFTVDPSDFHLCVPPKKTPWWQMFRWWRGWIGCVEVTETTVNRLLCCGFRRTGKAMGQVYQCWWRICREIHFFFSRFECFMFMFYIHLLPIYWFSLVHCATRNSLLYFDEFAGIHVLAKEITDYGVIANRSIMKWIDFNIFLNVAVIFSLAHKKRPLIEFMFCPTSRSSEERRMELALIFRLILHLEY
jgi:hypothetical protein